MFWLSPVSEKWKTAYSIALQFSIHRMQIIWLFSKVRDRKEEQSSIDNIMNIKSTSFQTVSGFVWIFSLATKRKLSLPLAFGETEAVVCKEGLILG